MRRRKRLISGEKRAHEIEENSPMAADERMTSDNGDRSMRQIRVGEKEDLVCDNGFNEIKIVFGK